MRLLYWLLCAAAAIFPVLTSEEKSLVRPKRESSDKKIVCYYTNWSVYRPGTAKFSPQNINPYLCTHLIYAFGGLSKDNALKPFDKYQDIEQGGYAKFNGLKTYNKNLKTMLAIGGWNEGSARFSPLVADPERRRELVKNTVKFLRQNHFDGLDLDWEYPSFRDGGKPRDRDNYASLVQEFREEFEKESEKTGRSRLLLTMAVPAGIEYIDKGYDVPKLNKYLDWMNILSYDYHSAFEPVINHHSPLFSLEEDDEYNFDAQLNIDYTVQHYIKLGADRHKLVLGIPTYGRSYSLFNPDSTEIGSPADGPGEQGEATREKGYLAYYEICERIRSEGWTLENPNPEAMGPYAYKGNQWVGYDDEDIARAKAKYVNDNDLGGIMFWSIDNDDFRGKCHGKPYPLIEAAKEALLASANELIPATSRSDSARSNSKAQEESSPKPKARKTRPKIKTTTTTEASKSKSKRTTTTPQPPTTPDPGSDFICKDEGFFPHPRDCKKYFWCLDSGPSSLGLIAHQFTCPSGLVFNKVSDSCDYARNVVCKTKSESPSTTSTTTTSTTTTTTTPRPTTARSKLVITASPPRTPSTTTTTTTQAPELEEDEEEDEEDPGTIKELINLIKKLGGVEQLEKQLNLQNSNEKERIKPSLYSKVLQGRTANRYRGVVANEELSTPKYVPSFRNRPVGPQSPSTEETSISTKTQDKPRYVTIQRNRGTKKPKVDEEEAEDEEEEEEVEEEKPKKKTDAYRPSRRRPSTDATTEKEYVSLRRARPQKTEEVSTSRYQNIVRVRSTTEAIAEEEEEEEEEIIEEDDGEEEEEETEDEQQPRVEKKEVNEPVQKYKKYSSIIRDSNKKVSDDEGTKVSGLTGPLSTNGSQIHSELDERKIVNNVNTGTSPRYVEIRRRPSSTTTESSHNVYTVNTEQNGIIEKTPVVNEVALDELNNLENDRNKFQQKSTTEIVKRSTVPSYKSFTIEKTPANIEPEKEKRVPLFRFRSSTEASSTATLRKNNQYVTINRNSSEKPLENRSEPSQLPKRERIFRTSTTTTSAPVENFSTTGFRRFQFGPRTKPTILSPKPIESTTEVFTITVPDLPPQQLTESGLHSDYNLPSVPSATVEPEITTTFSLIDSTILSEPENAVDLAFNNKNHPPSTRFFNPTTSTQTTVVTSITESAFTERKRFFIPKRLFRNNYDTNQKISSSTFAPTEILDEVTKPLISPPKYKTIIRSTTSKFDSTPEAKRARYKSKSTTTTTTTTTEVPEKRFIRKKTRNFKKITSTETPEFVSTSTQSLRFNFRNKPRPLEQGQIEPINSLNLRYNTNSRRKKVLSKEDLDEDLDVDQTSGFLDENTGRFILGGGLRQHSEKEFLNADIVFTNPPGNENANLTKAAALTNSLEITDSPNHPFINNSTVTAGTKEPVRNKLLANLALRNLKSRAQLSREKNTENATEKASTTTFSPRSTKSKNNFFTFNPDFSNLRNLKTRNQQTAEGEELDYRSENEKAEDNNLVIQRQRSKIVQFSDERVKPTPSDIGFNQLLKTTLKDSKNIFKEPDPNSDNLRYLRGRSRPNNFSGREHNQGTSTTKPSTVIESSDTIDKYNSRSTRARPLLVSRGLTAKQIETTTPPGFGTREPSKFDAPKSQPADQLNEENSIGKISKNRLEKLYQTTTPSGFGTRQTSKISTPSMSTSDVENGKSRSRPTNTFAPTEFKKVSQEFYSETTTPEGFGTRQANKFFTTNSNLLSSTNFKTKGPSSTLVSISDVGKSSTTTPSGLSTKPLSSSVSSRNEESNRGNQLSNEILPESLVEGSKNAQETIYSNNSVQRHSTTTSGKSFSRSRGPNFSITTTDHSVRNGFRDRDSKYLGSRTRQNEEANEKQSQRTTTQIEGVKEQSLVTASVLPRRTRVRTIKKKIGGNKVGVEVTTASSLVAADKSLVSNDAVDSDSTVPVNIQSPRRRPSLKGNGVTIVSSITTSDTTISSALDPVESTSFGQKTDTTIPDSLGSSSFDSPLQGINFVPPIRSTFASNSFSGFTKGVLSTEGFAKTSTGTTTRASNFPSTPNSSASIDNRARGVTRNFLLSSSPTQGSFRSLRTRTQTNESKVAELNSEALNEVRATEDDAESDFDSSRSRGRSSTTAKFTFLEKRINSNDETATNNTLTSPGSIRANFKNSINRLRATENAIDSAGQPTGISSLNEIPHTDRKEITTGSQKSRRVLVKTRPIQSKLETKGGEDVVEKSEVSPSVTLRPTTSRRNQEYTGARNKVRTTTTPAPSRERSEKRRTDLDRRRFRAELKSTSAKPDIQSETPSSVLRANTILRRRGRPTTSSTTTTTTTTTEEPISEVEEDSSLEESKALDEDPDIQDLADPAVVAIHNLATVSPGPISASSLSSPSARPTLKFYSGTPDTYTVHVTPSDIASITPGRVSSISTGTARPTSILTLKPFTIPVITKQTPSSFRTPSPFRGTGIPLVTEEPLVQRSEILARRLETTSRPRPLPSVTASPQKEVTIKAKKVKPFSKVTKQEVAQSVSSPEPPLDYEYYDDDDDPLANIPASALKVKVHSDGYIECLDRGNFPHPFSCKKFISCAKMENNELLGWEYTCPKHLSFDPVGGICNWSAGLGCQN